jgi:hypothetical protein
MQTSCVVGDTLILVAGVWIGLLSDHSIESWVNFVLEPMNKGGNSGVQKCPDCLLENELHERLGCWVGSTIL